MSTSGLSKATLRDSINRLKKIRVKCGKQDEEAKQLASTGDPFRDKMNLFSFTVKKVKDDISERNAGVKKNGQDRTAIEQSNAINRDIRAIEDQLKSIKELVDLAEKDLIKENKKKKPKANKVMMLEQQFKEREKTYQQCLEVLEAVRTLNSQRFGNDKGANPGGGVMGKKARLRETLGDLQKKGNKTSNVGADGEMEDMGGKQRSLRDDPETAAQMKVIDEQNRKINSSLDMVGKAVGRLHELAVQIGGEIDTQNRMLDNTEKKVDDETKQLKSINRRLNKLLKDTKPMNMIVNVGCFFLLLGLVGYFLYSFGAV